MANEVKDQPKAPDTQVTFEDVDLTQAANEGSGWIEDNQQLIVTVVGGLILIAAAIFAYRKFILEPKQEAASEMMWRAQQQFEQDSFQLALTNPAPGYLGFLDIIDEYGSTPAGNLANYYAGISYLQLGQYDAAIDYLNSFDEDGSILPATKAGAIGDAYAQKGDLDQATSYYESAVKAAGSNAAIAPYYIKKLALLRERNGDRAAANELYTRIQQEFPSSQEAGDISKFIARTAG